ncbi:MAG TPA: MbcA/ParS/Xre antitoxin family protein [Candidatus Baltobacteraceae bacterium]|nr:MbcA/ParS/Xre antitoxin family protein [Candidatus Baltobacteraceae bacterium]
MPRTATARRTAPVTPAPEDRLSGTAIEIFARIAALWKLSIGEQRTLLGGVPESTYFKYLKHPQSARLSPDMLERISHVLGIFKSINVLLPRHEAADAWIRRSNDASLFKGRSALEYVLSGRFEDLVAVRRYLDAMRGW